MRRTNQKFQSGDLVQLDENIPWITNGRGEVVAFRDGSGHRAVIEGSYADKFGGSSRETYAVVIEDIGWRAWYDGPYMSLLDENRHDLYEEWDNRS